MLNSSEGRWRKRLHLPNQKKRIHPHHQQGGSGSGGSHQNQHHNHNHYEQRRMSQGLLVDANDGKSIISSGSTMLSSVSPGARHPMMLNDPNSQEINNNSSLPQAFHQEALTQQRILPSFSTTPNHPHASAAPTATGWLIDHPPPPHAGGIMTPPNNIDQSGESGGLGSISSSTAMNQSQRGAAAIASLILIYLVTYVLYHISMEALADETGGAWAAHVGTLLAQHASADRSNNGGGDGGGDGGGQAVGVMRGGVWGPGVSLITVSAWQSFVALCAGLVMSRAQRKSAWRRVAEARPLVDAERTRRNRCLFVFAVAHLLGSALEYHSYGVVGSVAAEALRATETALFLALSLYFFRVHRRGLAALPTLLLAFGLALGAAPATGDLRVDGVGLEFSLAANFLLAVRAVTAKMAMDDYGVDEVSTVFSGIKMTAALQVVVLLTIEVPRAATGRSPCLLPHLWGVGMEEHEYAGAGSSTGVDHYAAADRGVLGGRGEGWVSGEERVKLTLLLVVNGLFLYGHVLALFALLSRLSSTAFAIVSGYVRAALVFVLLLSLKGSTTYPRSVGMLLSTIAVVVHFYRTYAGSSPRHKPSISMVGGGQSEVLKDGGESGQGKGSIIPLPQLRLFLREGSPAPASDSALGEGTMRGVDASPLSSGGRSSSGRREKQPQALFVPLLGTRHDVDGGAAGAVGLEGGRSVGGEGEGESVWDRHVGPAGFPSSSRSGLGVTSTSDEDGGDADSNSRHRSEGRGDGVSPSRFAWRWMGLRQSATRDSLARQGGGVGGGNGGRGGGSCSGSSPTTNLRPPSPPLLYENRSDTTAVEGGSGSSSRFHTRGNARPALLVAPTKSLASPHTASFPRETSSSSSTAGVGTFTGSSSGGAYTTSSAYYTAGSAGISSRLQGAFGVEQSSDGTDNIHALARADEYASASAGGGTLGHPPASSDSGTSSSVRVSSQNGRGGGIGVVTSSAASSGRRQQGLSATRTGSGSGLGRDVRLTHHVGAAGAHGGGVAMPGGEVDGRVGAGEREAKERGCSGGGGGGVSRASTGSSVRTPSPASSSSFSLNGFEVIDKEDMWT